MAQRLAGLILLALAANAAAQENSGPQNARLSWTAPTHYTNGEPLPAEATYTYVVHRLVTPTDSVEVWAGAAHEILLTLQPLGEQCYYVVAVVDGVPSAPSAVVCKTMRLAPPSDGSIEMPSDGSFEYPR